MIGFCGVVCLWCRMVGFNELLVLLVWFVFLFHCFGRLHDLSGSLENCTSCYTLVW